MTEMKYSQTSVYKSLMFARNGLTISTIAQYHVTIVAQRFPRKTGHHYLHRINKHFTTEFQIRNKVGNKQINKQSGGVMLVYLNGVRGELRCTSSMSSGPSQQISLSCSRAYKHTVATLRCTQTSQTRAAVQQPLNKFDVIRALHFSTDTITSKQDI